MEDDRKIYLVLIRPIVFANLLVIKFNLFSDYCPWTRLDTGCYQFFQDRKNWSSAQALCMERGGHLAELTGGVKF